MSAPLVVGLDLSITATGICDANGDCMTAGGDAKRGDNRLRLIHGGILVCCGIEDEEWSPRADLVVIEGLAQGRQGGNGLAAAQVMGVAKLTLLQAGILYALVAPATLKKFATGRGNATKADMAVALYKRTGLELANDNEVDAFWLRAAGLHALGAPLVDLPKAHTDALAKVEWPTHLLREDTP